MMVKEEVVENESSIFQGMSFPQVPATPIIIPSQTLPPQQQTLPSQQQTLPPRQQTLPPQQQTLPSQQQSATAKAPPQLNFSTLYIAESESNVNRIPYPELPTIPTTSTTVNHDRKNNVILAYNQYNNIEYQHRNENESNNGMHGIMNTMRSFVVGEPHIGYERVATNDDENVRSVEMQSRECAIGTAPPGTSANVVQSNPIITGSATVVTQGINQVNNVPPQHADNTLIYNLIGENARLARENQLLKQRIEANGLSVAPDVGDMVMDRMRTAQQPPVEGVKYVCCGRCRQWLRAPKEAVYVYCSSCDAVNNCSTTVPRQPSSDNIIRRWLGPLENCFPGIFSNESFYSNN